MIASIVDLATKDPIGISGISDNDGHQYCGANQYKNLAAFRGCGFPDAYPAGYDVRPDRNT